MKLCPIYNPDSHAYKISIIYTQLRRSCNWSLETNITVSIMTRETVILQGTILIVFYTSYNEAHGLYIYGCVTQNTIIKRICLIPLMCTDNTVHNGLLIIDNEYDTDSLTFSLMFHIVRHRIIGMSLLGWYTKTHWRTNNNLILAHLCQIWCWSTYTYARDIRVLFIYTNPILLFYKICKYTSNNINAINISTTGTWI